MTQLDKKQECYWFLAAYSNSLCFSSLRTTLNKVTKLPHWLISSYSYWYPDNIKDLTFYFSSDFGY